MRNWRRQPFLLMLDPSGAMAATTQSLLRSQEPRARGGHHTRVHEGSKLVRGAPESNGPVFKSNCEFVSGNCHFVGARRDSRVESVRSFSSRAFTMFGGGFDGDGPDFSSRAWPRTEQKKYLTENCTRRSLNRHMARSTCRRTSAMHRSTRADDDRRCATSVFKFWSAARERE